MSMGLNPNPFCTTQSPSLTDPNLTKIQFDATNLKPMDETVNKWTLLSQNLCLCQTTDHDINLLLAAPDCLHPDSVGNKDRLVLVGSLQTTYKRALEFATIPMCERLFHFLMEVPWCERLMKSLVLVSDDQFVEYACAKLLAHVLLAVKSPSQTRRWVKELSQTNSLKSKLASLTVFQTLLDHGHESNHPSGGLSDLLNRCTRLVSPPKTEPKIQLELLQSEQTTGLIKEAVAMETTEAVCASLRIWDSALDLYKRRGHEPVFWGLELVEVILKMDNFFTKWPTVAILKFLAIVNKYQVYGVKKGCSEEWMMRIGSLAVVVIDLYLNGGFDAVAQFGPVRNFGGWSTPAGVESVNAVFRLSALLLLKSVVLATALDCGGDSKKIALRKFVHSIKYLKEEWVWRVFSEEDDSLADALDSTLDIYINLGGQDVFGDLMEPNKIFYSVICHLSFDYQVILDWIISNETCFLSYFVKYLKYLICCKCEKSNEKSILVDYSSSSSDSDGDDGFHRCELRVIIELCANLNRSISKLDKRGVFPFNVNPLVKLLNQL